MTLPPEIGLVLIGLADAWDIVAPWLLLLCVGVLLAAVLVLVEAWSGGE